jgi:hypothetical protein
MIRSFLQAALFFFFVLSMGCAVEPLSKNEKNCSRAGRTTTRLTNLDPLPDESPTQSTAKSRSAQKDFSFGYWLNGWRKTAEDRSPDTLCFETGSFGMTLDMANFNAARFGRLDDSVDYQDALAADSKRLLELDPAQLNFHVKVGTNLYRAISCRAGNGKGVKRLQSARMWESGRLVQHFDLLELVLKDRNGEQLECNATLDMVAWPDSLALTATITPGVLYEDGPHPGVNHSGWCVLTKPLKLPDTASKDYAEFSLEAWVKIPLGMVDNNKGYLVSKNGGDGSKGNFGFKIDEGLVEAVLNVSGGREQKVQIPQRRDAFHLDNWNLLGLTYDGNVMSFYINGKFQGSRNVNLPRSPMKGSLIVGGSAAGPKPVPGIYDQILIWNRALSAKEMEVHAEDARKMEDRRGLSFYEMFTVNRRLEEDVPVWEDAAIRLQLKTDEDDWNAKKHFPEPWEAGDKQSLTLLCDLRKKPMPAPELTVEVGTVDHQRIDAPFDEKRNAYTAVIEKIKRGWKGGYTDIRNYDDLSITVENSGREDLQVPVLIDLRSVANITGLCPILCDEKGVPTGIPVQLSKNWHYRPLGNYLRAYALVPAKPGTSTYILRIAYGFYGSLPSASHAQLSLVGYGGNGRWDQLAIGCWGETICMDMDMSCVDVTVTDVRMLMARNGLNGPKWNWTDGGWGGDWLNAQGSKGSKLFPSEWKTAYLSHGPCLTEVRYDGKYGSRREVDLAATVRTLRTDDYARTFKSLHYQASESASLKNGWLFKMGRSAGLRTPQIAYGHGKGLLAEQNVPENLKPNQRVVDQVTLEGEGPWWVAFPGATPFRKTWGTGSRALIIRSYEAQFAGTSYTQPTISMPVYQAAKNETPNLDLLLVPPRGVTGFVPGDEVKMDLEWVTVPRTADDYYGPDVAFGKHLAKNPGSWRTVYREATGNNLQVEVRGGTVLKTYPLIVHTNSSKVVVEIRGGVGAVPLRFEGLHAATGYTLYRSKGGTLKALDQAVHGNDFWQTDYDPKSNSWKRTSNLPLDGVAQSTWVLVRDSN